MIEPTFIIGLADLKTLSNAVCDLDSLKPPQDARMAERVSIAHGIIIRTLGDHAAAVYAPDDGSEKAQITFPAPTGDWGTPLMAGDAEKVPA